MGKRNHLTRVWLRQHDAGERRLAAAVAKFLNGQADHLADEIAQHANPTHELASSIVNIDAENAAFQKAIGVELLRLSCLGAHLELEAANASKSFGLSLVSDLASRNGIIAGFFELPANILASIKGFLGTLEVQDYWKAIQRETKTRLASVIESGISDGDSLPEIVRRVRSSLGGDAARTRAKAIARTESTGCLNAGHYECRRSLISDGTISGGSEWLSLDGARETHAALDGVVTKDLFNVGGHMAPYPGYYGLPAQERVNCRCTTVANFGDEFD